MVTASLGGSKWSAIQTSHFESQIFRGAVT